MRQRALLILACFLILSAAPNDDWLRDGNDAFDRGDFNYALECYHQAAAATQDPGRVAFNQGAAHYELQQYADAEQAYARSLEDAQGSRRALALYGRGNSLASLAQHQRGRPAVEKLLLAVQSYKNCLALEDQLATDPGTPQELWGWARHNLGQVERLLMRKQAEPMDEPPDPSDPNNPTNGGNPPTTPRNDQVNPMAPGQPDKGEPQPPHTSPDQQAEPPRATDQTAPGKGNLPPLLDDKNSPALDRQRALEYLRQNMERIHRDQADRTPPEMYRGRSVRDW